LAARIAQLPTVAVDSGFFSPPQGQPLPIFRNQTQAELLSLRVLEHAVKDRANEVLAHFNAPLLKDCAELLQADHALFPHHGALDVYDRSDKTSFVGPFIRMPDKTTQSKALQQLAVTQPAPATSLKAFAYLTAEFPLSTACLEALVATGMHVTAYVAKAQAVPRIVQLAEAANFNLLTQPADMHSILPMVDMVVCHAGVCTIDMALAYGKPLLVVPTFAEQTFNAFRVNAHRLGAIIQVGTWPEPAQVVQQFLKDLPAHAQACQQFAQDNPPGDAHAAAQTLATLASQSSQSSQASSHASTAAQNHPVTTGATSTRFSDLDVIFLSYDEPNADTHFALLQTMAPQAKRVHGVKGFDAAHKAAAEVASTERFITVDADTQVLPAFFATETVIPPHIQKSTLSWSSVNVVNGMCYGNGGIKIWHKDMISSLVSHEQAKGALAYDFCHHAGYSQYDACFSTTYPNASPRQAFRAGLREVVKLGRNAHGDPMPPSLIAKLMGQLNMRRLLVCMTTGADTLNGDWMMLGARTGFWLNSKPDFNPETVTDFTKFAEFWDKDYADLAAQPQQDVEAALVHMGDRIRTELDFSLLQEWDAQRSLAFKQQLTQRRPVLGVFESGAESL
jgi:hypothetical protein